MVKAKKKRKKELKKKPSRDMFVKGGLNLLIFGGFIGCFYYTLYLLIYAEAHIEEVSYNLILGILEELGTLLLFFCLIFMCFYFMKEKDFFQKWAGSFLVSGALLSLPVLCYSLYEVISPLKEQTLTLQTFVLANVPDIMENISKIYLFVGAALLGIFWWGVRKERTWAAEFFVGAAVTGCAVLATSVYNTYDGYILLLGMYGDASKDLIISQFLIPEILSSVAWILIAIGVMVFAASHISKRFNFRKWAGRTWFFGGATGVFLGFIRLGMNSQAVQSEITEVRQSIMQLTPYSTVLKNVPLTIETLKEYYVKKMIPVYMEQALWILLFAAIALIGIYLWARE